MTRLERIQNEIDLHSCVECDSKVLSFCSDIRWLVDKLEKCEKQLDEIIMHHEANMNGREPDDFFQMIQDGNRILREIREGK
jgi:hypothetical protein